MIMDNKVNLTQSNKDYAVFLPAISFIYADLLSKNEKEKYACWINLNNGVWTCHHQRKLPCDNL